MAELKTKPNDQNVLAFLNGVSDEQQRRDCFTIMELMREATGAEPRMWGDNIVGFGSYTYSYASGRTGDWFLVGFAPRKQNLTLYINAGFEQDPALLEALGKHSTGKACLYIKHLDDISLPALKELIGRSVAHMVEANA
jgi:hypothetical protein